jgi:hypothetical protein
MPGHVDPSQQTPLAQCRVHPIVLQQAEINGECLQDDQLHVQHSKADYRQSDHPKEDREGKFYQVAIQKIEH